MGIYEFENSFGRVIVKESEKGSKNGVKFDGTEIFIVPTICKVKLL